MSVRHSLAAFQAEAVDSMAGTIRQVARDIARRPEDARTIALQAGTLLLQAPTGSGKTLMLGRALEAVTGSLPQPMIWLWFAPFAGLVMQTRESLAAQCPGLRLRDLTADREAKTTRDGDVFVQTWAAVATKNKDARRIRSDSESVHSLDIMLEILREEGFRIGVVIDEAHIAFRSATEATQFYLNVLKPDITLLATATPNDERLRDFAKTAGLSVEWRVDIARRDVVAAGLNKRGLMLGIVRFREEIEKYLDLETAALTAGWTQHSRIADRLQERGIALTPLMLVQVEDQEQGGPDPVDRVKAKLIEIGVPEAAIAVHTSGQPDANFHTLAYDPSRQVLVFKMAVATGFDAPRAWTLVSVRPNRGRDFGMQVVGRIMRVHASVRPIHGEDGLLDRGYVFLSDADVQQGLEAAAREIEAVEHSIGGVADQLDVVDYAIDPSSQLGLAEPGPRAPTPPATAEERQFRLNRLIEAGMVPEAVKSMPPATQDKAILAGETVRRVTETPLFGEALPKDAVAGVAPARPISIGPSYRAYPLRRDLGVPERLLAERPPSPEVYDGDDFLRSVAKGFIERGELVRLVTRKRQAADVSLRDLFLGDSEQLQLHVRLSNRRIADQAQGAFEFNDSINPRLLKLALLSELKASALQAGIEFEDADLKRAIDLGALGSPDALVTAVRETMARFRKVVPAEPIPDPIKEREGLPVGRLAAHGIFTSDMNIPEAAFAQMVDEDDSGTILWWLRTPHNTPWAGKLILPNGRSFFPDFAVGVRGRSTPQQIALVEIKDDGTTGRLNADDNNLKAQVQHMEYRKPFWAARGPDGAFERLEWNASLRRIVATDRFQVQTLVLVG
jgi:hypothetical protein